MTSGLAERIEHVLRLAPEAGALEFKGDWHTWGELADAMGRLERVLADGGLGEGAQVGVILRNRPGSLAALLQVLGSRRCVVPINPFQDPEKIARDLRSLKVSALVADPQDWEVPAIKDAALEAGLLGIAITSVPRLGVGQVAGLERVLGSNHEPLPGCCILMLTSGTTGDPKRVRLGYKGFERAMLMQASLERGSADPSPRLKTSPTLLTGPLVHIGGTYHAVAAIVCARPLAILEKFNVADWREMVLRHRPKVAALPPTALRMVLDADIPRADLGSLRCITAGSAPLDPNMADEWEGRYGFPILDVYGATEFAGAVAGWTLEDYHALWRIKRGSVGRALPKVELRVVDQAGTPLAVGNVGVLEVRSQQVGDGNWVRTTDLARIDEDGFLFIEGRADDAIIRGGFKVLPPEIEAVLRRHPDVQDVCVVGIPDARLGAIPVAAVQAKDGKSVSLQEADLMAHARKHLVAYQVPVRIKILADLPRTQAMKVSKHEVRRLFVSAVAGGK
jgi:acyl-CoA synthetase (AMP-forming)/AMP-acid ligase II